MIAPIPQVAQSIRQDLEERGLQVHKNTQHKDCLDIHTVDASPQDQQAIDEVCKKHQAGHSHIMSDGYLYDNVLPDIPQAEYVLTFHDMTKELYSKLRKKASEFNPEPNQALIRDLFRGIVPGFWAESDPRCCVCQKPITDTSQAHSRTLPTSPRIYRHRECGDFYPTPPPNNR